MTDRIFSQELSGLNEEELRTLMRVVSVELAVLNPQTDAYHEAEESLRTLRSALSQQSGKRPRSR